MGEHGTVRVGRQRYLWKVLADGVTVEVRDAKGRLVGHTSKWSSDERIRLSEVTAVVRAARRRPAEKS